MDLLTFCVDADEAQASLLSYLLWPWGCVRDAIFIFIHIGLWLCLLWGLPLISDSNYFAPFKSNLAWHLPLWLLQPYKKTVQGFLLQGNPQISRNGFLQLIVSRTTHAADIKFAIFISSLAAERRTPSPCASPVSRDRLSLPQ